MGKARIILSGGGTGGHIYPAVSTAQALTARLGDDVEILFVGAVGKMEMEKIPALGYEIVGLNVSGLYRKLDARNLTLPFKIADSLIKARRLIKKFRPDVVAGFGGYASAPVLWEAQRLGVPTLIQEQNSYAGVTNKLLSRRASRICVSYEGMERFFPAERMVMTGNPLRGNFSVSASKEEACAYFGLDPLRPVVLVVGGSLGTRTLNEMMKAWIEAGRPGEGIQVIWQNGKIYDAEMAAFMEGHDSAGIWRGAFIDRMDLAYSAADIAVSRSGACSVSELCLVGKPTVFVPSPNVAEDHQTKNATALSDRGAAITVPDSKAVTDVMPAVSQLLSDKARMESMSQRISDLAIADSADRVASQIISLISRNA